MATLQEKLEFSKQWEHLLDALFEMHQKGVEIGVLRKRLTFAAGSKGVK